MNPQPSNGANFTPHVPADVESLIPSRDGSMTALDLIRGLTIRNGDERMAAKSTYDDAKRAFKRLDDARLDIGREMNDFRDRLLVRIGITPAIAHYKEVIGIVEGKLKTYDTEVERLRRQEEERLQAIARAEADEKRRQAAEVKRKAQEKANALRAEQEKARLAAEQASKERAEAEAANDQAKAKEAARAEAAANRQAAALDTKIERVEERAADKAQELNIKADLVPVPTIESEDDRSVRWGAELDVKDGQTEEQCLNMLIDAANGADPVVAFKAREMLMFNQPRANTFGSTMRHKLNVPGVRAVARPYYTTKKKG